VRQGGTNLPKVGQYNRAVVLDQIQLADGTSRVEIAEHTGLTPQTVSGIVRRLIDEGIVREDGARSSGGGKPRTVLRINPDARRAVGLHFDPIEVACVVVDLLGRPLVTARRATPLDMGPAHVTATMAELVDKVLAEAAVDREHVLGVGLATPGPIDQSLSEVISPPQLPGWTRVPLKQLVANATGLPVTLDNDATAAAIGERWAGAGRGVANFAYFLLGTGVGGGLVLGHQVHRGASMNAAEFGHTSVAEGGPPCYCGNRGCLEAYINPAALVAEAHAGLAAGIESALSSAFRSDPSTVDQSALCRAAAAGDAFAGAVIEQAAERLATVAVDVVNIVDVELIILGGHAIRHVESKFRQAVVRALGERAIARRIRDVDVALSPLGDDAAVVGAAALVLHSTFSPQVSSLLAG
jgi:predicted NBD/HSP70 family sugar kinase